MCLIVLIVFIVLLFKFVFFCLYCCDLSMCVNLLYVVVVSLSVAFASSSFIVWFVVFDLFVFLFLFVVCSDFEVF